MSNDKIFTVTIFLTILISSSTSEENKCGGTYRFNEEELAGHWNYLAQVSAWPLSSHCAGLFLKSETNGTFTGYWYAMIGSRVSNTTLRAHLVGNTLEFSFFNKVISDYGRAASWILSTCNDNTELALAEPGNEWYHIFGRNNEASTAILAKYQALANEQHLKLEKPRKASCK